METDCLFCKIVTGEISSYKVYEDADFVAFFDISQFTPGHTLLVPKEHLRFVWDSKDIGKYFATAKKIVDHYKSLGFIYVDSLVFGRGVKHAHLHLIPHNGNDPDWQQVLAEIEKVNTGDHHSLTQEKAELLLKRFKLQQ